jgi:hypothetical protein
MRSFVWVFLGKLARERRKDPRRSPKRLEEIAFAELGPVLPPPPPWERGGGRQSLPASALPT